MNSSFDLNLPFIDEERQFLFDLNQTPTSDEILNNEDDNVPVVNNPSGFNEFVAEIDLDDEREFLFDLNQTPTNQEIYPEIDNHAEINNHAEIPHGTKLTTSNKQRWEIYYALLERSRDGKLGKKTIREVSDLFLVPVQTVQRIWKRAKDTSNGEVNVSHKKAGRCGRKRISLDLNKIKEIPFHQRTTLRSLSVGLGMSHSTLHKILKEGTIRRHTNAIKPSLNADNMKGRLKFCLSMLDKNTLTHEPKFVNMYNIVHIDEKWFYMTKKMEKYYLLPDEEVPHRTCQSKNYIGKVMFLAAMARPRFDEEGNEIFSGKIGVFPFVTVQPAKRRSKHREVGTLELKALTSVKREDIKSCLIEKVIPRIHERWPVEDRAKPILIQQDNARTHVSDDDIEFQEAASKNGFDIHLMCQPPNSPDLNILDLGFFNAIQSLQHKKCPKTVKDLVHAVEQSFDEYPTQQVNHIFLTLQSCMKEVMKSGGSNKYKIPHMKKSTLAREDRLPLQISCDVSLVQSVTDTLASMD